MKIRRQIIYLALAVLLAGCGAGAGQQGSYGAGGTGKSTASKSSTSKSSGTSKNTAYNNNQQSSYGYGPPSSGQRSGASSSQAKSANGNGKSTRTKMVTVKEVEFKIEMPHTLPAGKTTFKVENKGKIIHNFEIKGNGIDKVFGSVLQPDGTRDLTVNLKPGMYKVWCPVGQHAQAGMKLQLQVK